MIPKDKQVKRIDVPPILTIGSVNSVTGTR
jgi:hypothetical protein